MKPLPTRAIGAVLRAATLTCALSPALATASPTAGSSRPAQGPTAVAPASAPAPITPRPASPPAAEEEAPDPRSGARFQPTRQAEIFADRELELGKARFRPGKGLTFESADGRFALATRLRAQMLYSIAHDQAAAETEHGLQIRRARLQFGGHFFGKHNRFKAEFALSPRDMGFDGVVTHRTPILDWYFDFTHLRDLQLRIGQYKVPYSRQRVVSSGNLQLVDRTAANGEFNLDRDIGLDLRSRDLFGVGKLRYYAGVYLGEGRDQYNLGSAELFYLVRVEVLPFGMFNDYSEADFDRSLRPRLSLGAAYAFVDGAVGRRGVLGPPPSDGGTTDYHSATADAMFKLAGLSLFSEFFLRVGRREFGDATVIDEGGAELPAPREAARNGIGGSLTLGYMIPRTFFELAARYAAVAPFGPDTSIVRRDELGGGLSYYFGGHPFKLQADYFARIDQEAPVAVNHVVRIQLQAGF